MQWIRQTTLFRRTVGYVVPVPVLVVLAACGGPDGETEPDPGAWMESALTDEVGADVVSVESGTTVVPDRTGPPDSDVREIPQPSPGIRLAYEEQRPKSILELQQWRRVEAVSFTTSAGRDGVATLVELNPAIGEWLLVRLEWIGGGDPEVYHLENPFASVQTVRLDADSGTGLRLVRGGQGVTCELWSAEPSALATARTGGRAFAPLCGEQLYLRNPTEGRRTSKEWAADFLRDRVWGGERITTLVRDKLFADSFRRTGKLSRGSGAADADSGDRPLRPRLAPQALELSIQPSGLGLSVEREPGGRLLAGRWYPVRDTAGIWVSAARADLVETAIIDRQRTRVNPLEAQEEAALVYVVAFDLDRFELGFALGTEHPRLGWSERVRDSERDGALPGPDGIGSAAPLARTGMLSPAEAARVVATFTGGFKRSHGAFKTTELALRNHGSHYGMIEKGVIFSKLQPGLSTLAVYRDGRVAVGSWTDELNEDLLVIRHARQNGVPILERDPATGEVRPGARVKEWAAGNWSGSVDKKLRTLRAGTCVQDGSPGRFLLYGYFSGATPSGMARVFEAYGCGEAMMLDMNALEHTYLAVYREQSGRRVVERLIDEMRVLDKEVAGETVPRFVGFPDNRDFFFLLGRPAQ